MKINQIHLTHFRAFYDEYIFNFEGKNILVYGENGSGKSSLYYALKTLVDASSLKEKERIQLCFTKESETFLGNVFAYDKETPKAKALDLGQLSLEFFFDDDSKILLEELQKNKEFPNFDKKIQNTYFFSSFLHYKKILKAHSVQKIEDTSNLFPLFETLLQGYLLDENTFLVDLRETDYPRYLKELKQIIEKVIKGKISYFLQKFEQSVEIEDIVYSEELKPERIIRKYELSVLYQGQKIKKWSHFLNEARLSAISISIYLAIIQSVREKLDKSLDILVLDDLLLGLDMSNRMKVIKILQEDFQDFQIFFFTYDKALFEAFKSRTSRNDWKYYKMYNQEKELTHIQDEFGENIIIETPLIIESSKSFLEKAKKFFVQKEYDCCGIYLRKELEDICDKYLKENEKRDKNCEVLDLSKQIDKLNQKYRLPKEIIQNIHKIRKEILNPTAHNDREFPIFKAELQEAIEWIETLQDKLS